MHTILLSPAKSIKSITSPHSISWTDPLFAKQTEELANGLQKLSVSELKALYKVSDNIAHLNFERYRDWNTPTANHGSRGALYQFDGDVYKKLNVSELNLDSIRYLQKHLSILSGLYGLLRPLDQIKPYRLEMGTKWGIRPNEYVGKYWKPLLTEYIQSTKPNFIVNLASNEYSTAIDKKMFQEQWVDIHFLQYKDGKYRNVGIYAKQARGLMTRFMAQQSIDNRADLKLFNLDRYELKEDQSNDNTLTFVR